MRETSDFASRKFNRYIACAWGGFAEACICAGDSVGLLLLFRVYIHHWFSAGYFTCICTCNCVVNRRGGDYRLLPIQLTTIRPLLIKECSLAELCAESASSAQSGSAPSRPRSQSEDAEAEMDGQVWRVLTEVVDVLLQRFEQERGVVAVEIKSQKTSKLPASKRRRAYQLFCNYSGGTQDAAPFKASLSSGQAAHKNLKAKLAKHRLPLVRVRVESRGYSTINTARFGLQFIGRVANPDSLITFYKKRSIATRCVFLQVSLLTPWLLRSPMQLQRRRLKCVPQWFCQRRTTSGSRSGGISGGRRGGHS